MDALAGLRIAVVGTGAVAYAAAAAFEREGAAVGRIAPDDHGDVADAVRAAIAVLGGLDVLVNLSAPDGSELPAEAVSHDDWERILKATVRTARTSNQAAFAHMRDNGGGLVLNLAEAAAELGVPGRALASAAAQAAVALSNASASAWFGTGVRINVIQPGSGSDVETNVVPTLVFLASNAARGLHGKTFPC